MVTLPKPPRTRCERCLRPVSHCLCAHIPALSSRTQVLVLQHPDESRHPLNTARLAVLGLQGAELWEGECFPQLPERVAAAQQAVLLFPATGDTPSMAASSVSPASPEASTLLIVPDGTWRKARRIVRANPALETLPRLALPPGEPSAYRVRKALEPAAVSTIEAIVRALTLLEPQQDFRPLLRPFNVLIEQQIQAMGPEVYRRNHAGAE